uniref:Uncharacterized protein n=1 Tax=Oryza sativa subsp. japonica TaxID=39947 RepID=Q2QUR4_ORYSJ|nr:hypothetical protein LOC_Os12g15370 [Oryza sativa Japonica Group]
MAFAMRLSPVRFPSRFSPLASGLSLSLKSSVSAGRAEGPSWYTSNKPLTGKVRTLEDAEAEASKMVEGLTTAEFGCLLQRQADGRANRVHAGELACWSIPSRVADDDVWTSRKHKRAVAKGRQVRTQHVTKDAADTDADEEDNDEREAGSDEDGGSRGYTPSPTWLNAGTGSHASPTGPQDVAGANVLLEISSSVVKPGVIDRKKNKGW